jgi:polysaccharide export outer membrane protein
MKAKSLSARLLALAFLTLVAACASNPELTPASATARSATAPYRIGPGDTLRVFVWGNPGLSDEVPVRPDGRISVPLLGDVQAAGMTPLALKQTLTDGYKEYVTAPGVSVVVKEIHSRKIYVTGEVAHPGTFDLEPKGKLMQALALAGGLTPYAKGRVVVLRDGLVASDERQSAFVEKLGTGGPAH